MSTIQLQLPEAILEAARRLAESGQIPLEEFVAAAVTQWITQLRDLDHLKARGERGNRDAFLAVLAKAPDATPAESDEF